MWFYRGTRTTNSMNARIRCAGVFFSVYFGSKKAKSFEKKIVSLKFNRFICPDMVECQNDTNGKYGQTIAIDVNHCLMVHSKQTMSTFQASVFIIASLHFEVSVSLCPWSKFKTDSFFWLGAIPSKIENRNKKWSAKRLNSTRCLGRIRFYGSAIFTCVCYLLPSATFAPCIEKQLRTPF